MEQSNCQGLNDIVSRDLHKSLTIRHIRIIAALAELKLVARVADELNVTQPAISKQIAELERIVGTPIVTRDRNRLHLTAIGLRLAEHAHQVLNQIDRAAFDIEAMSSGVALQPEVGVSEPTRPTGKWREVAEATPRHLAAQPPWSASRLRQRQRSGDLMGGPLGQSKRQRRRR